MKDRLESNLTRLEAWCRAHCLRLSGSKTQYVIFCTKQMQQQLPSGALSVGGAEVAPAPFLKNLGVTMDQKLSFAHHVGDVAHTVIFPLAKHSNSLPVGSCKVGANTSHSTFNLLCSHLGRYMREPASASPKKNFKQSRPRGHQNSSPLAYYSDPEAAWLAICWAHHQIPGCHACAPCCTFAVRPCELCVPV